MNLENRPLQAKVKPKKKAHVLQNECVACGTCVKACPKNAITVYKGIYAVVDESLCTGCTKCMKVCPASVIHMKEVLS